MIIKTYEENFFSYFSAIENNSAKYMKNTYLNGMQLFAKICVYIFLKSNFYLKID